MASELQQQARKLLKESKEIRETEDALGHGKFNSLQAQKWLNDIKLFASRLPEDYPLKREIERSYFHRSRPSTFNDMVSYLESIVTDDFSEEQGESLHNLRTSKIDKKYDLFISHANKDKGTFVNELYEIFAKLGIDIFYDKESLSWGDKWKEKIYEGTEKSEFAIVVISKNFIGKEWTEKELGEFLRRQNSSHQKIILPLLYNITREELLAKYPSLEEIQYISSEDYSVEEICILFAKELIKRLRD